MTFREKKAPGKARLIFLIVLFTAGWLLILGRLAQIQVVYGAEYGDRAKRQSTGKISVKPMRGLIYDRKGRQVAINVIKNSLYAYPSSNAEIRRIKRYLSKLYSDPDKRARIKKAPLKPNRFRWLDRKLSDEMADRILADSIPGLYVKEESGREYPFGNIGCQLLGRTDIDGVGIGGLEFSHDSILAGSPGLYDYLRDAKSQTYRIREIPLVKQTPGHSIVLTIDWQLQEIVEEELQAAVEKYNAIQGEAVFLDCQTGEILAAADCTPGEKSDAVKLKAVSDVFEPGSIFKVFTAAALIENELVDTTELIYCEEGAWKCGRRILRDDKKLDSLAFRSIFELSSNIGIGKLALRLGGDKLVETAKTFGFENMTMIGLPGEQAGHIGRPGVWSDYNIAALAMGHSISVTPLQLAVGAASIANGGELFQPQIIRGIVSHDGDILKKNKPKLVRRVVDNETAELLQSFMEGVVERGTATPAKSDLVTIAGKTGTAEMIDPENGGYIKNRFIASFLGFFPVEKPQIAGVVILHRPEPIHYGGYTSGPTFTKIAERYSVANADYIQPDARMTTDGDELELIEIPDFLGQDLKYAKNYAEKKGLQLSANLDSGLIVWQYPPHGRKIAGDDILAIMVEDTASSKARMLNLKGMKVRTAIAALNYQGLKFDLVGSGKIKRQFPNKGDRVGKKAVCRIVAGKS